MAQFSHEEILGARGVDPFGDLLSLQEDAEVGTELPDIDAARAAAASLAHRLLLDDAERFWSTAEWSLEVKDETGSTVFALRFQQGAAVNGDRC